MNSPLRRLAGAMLYTIPFFFGAELFFDQSLETSSKFRFFLSIILFLGGLAIVSNAIALSLLDLICGKEKTKPVSSVVYRIAERLAEKKRYREAVHEYEKIIQRHPQELRAHIGLIHALKESHRDPSYIQKATQRASLHCVTFSDHQNLRSILSADTKLKN